MYEFQEPGMNSTNGTIDKPNKEYSQNTLKLLHLMAYYVPLMRIEEAKAIATDLDGLQFDPKNQLKCGCCGHAHIPQICHCLVLHRHLS